MYFLSSFQFICCLYWKYDHNLVRCSFECENEKKNMHFAIYKFSMFNFRNLNSVKLHWNHELLETNAGQVLAVAFNRLSDIGWYGNYWIYILFLHWKNCQSACKMVFPIEKSISRPISHRSNFFDAIIGTRRKKGNRVNVYIWWDMRREGI